MQGVRLEIPNAALLGAYVEALRTGWSPSNSRDLSGPHLAAIEVDPAAFLAEYEWAAGKTTVLADGEVVPRLRGHQYWISDGAFDGAFCGTIGLRYQAGTIELPSYTSGHVGYTIVPWKRRQGIATAALRALLPIAHEAGLGAIVLTTDPDNVESQHVISGVGGVRIADQPANATFAHRYAYRIQTAR